MIIKLKTKNKNTNKINKTIYWIFEKVNRSGVACYRDRSSRCNNPGVMACGISPLRGCCHYPNVELPSRQLINWRTIIPKNFSHCCKSSGHTTGFPTWESSKEIENPQGIWLRRPVGFDYSISTELGKQTLGGRKKTLCPQEPRRKEQWPHKRLSQTSLWVSVSLGQRCGSTVHCREVRGTEYNSPGNCSLLALVI